MIQKRRLLGAWCALMVWGSASAQNDVPLGLALAPNVSHGISRDYSHEPIEAAVRFGYQFIFDWKFTDTYAIGSGVNVFHTGGYIEHYAVTDTARVGYVKWGVRNQYVEVPLTFKMRTKEIGYTTYYGQFGLGLGINVRAEVDERTAPAWSQDSTGHWTPIVLDLGDADPLRKNFEANTRFFRPALIVGLGAERSLLGKTAICMGLTYNMGLANQFTDLEIVRTNTSGLPVDASGAYIATEGTVTEPDAVNMKGKTGFLQFSVGLMF